MKILHSIGDELEDFADRVVREMPLARWISSTPVIDCGDIAIGSVIREGQFQVELVSARAGLLIHPHTHPHMDSIEVPLMGVVRLSVGDKDTFAGWSDEAYARFVQGKGIRVGACEWHGGKVGTTSAVFLSIQHWNRDPRSALEDWHGEAITPRHGRLLDAAVA
jgi:hypothetical protein